MGHATSERENYGIGEHGASCYHRNSKDAGEEKCFAGVLP